MAVKIAAADGNLTTAGTWGDVATASSSFLDSEANSTASTTAYVESAAITPGAVTIDGIAIKIASRVASPTGTISVRLANAGVTVAGTEVTINVSDIPSRAAEQGWILFKFAGVLLVAATNYTVSVKTSVNAEVTMYRNATAGNWSRMLRTTTTGAPAAGDSFHVLGEWTAAATKTNRTVSMDSTASTDYGDGSTSNPGGITIGIGGTLQFLFAAATNYILKVSTQLIVNYGGTFTIGTVANPIPRDGTALLQFDSAAADGDFGLVVYGTFICQGLSRTAAKLVNQCLLNANVAAAGVLLTYDTDTGWLNGDDIAVASTTRTYNETEIKAATGNAGATTQAITAMTNAHNGTSPTQAECVLMTYNVRIESASATFMAYVFFGIAATVDVDWTRFRYLGSTTTGRRGVEIQTTSAGSCAISYSGLREFDNHGIYITGAAADNITLFQVVGYKVGSQSSGHAAIGLKTPTTGVAWSITYCTILGNNAGGGWAFEFQDIGGTVTNIRAAGSGGAGTGGIQINEAAGITGAGWTDLTSHSNNGVNINMFAAQAAVIANVNQWRGSAGGFQVTEAGELTINTGLWFGNATDNLSFVAGAYLTGRMIFRTLTIAGDSTFSTGTGCTFPGSSNRSFAFVRFENCTFGVATGIYVAHATQDINFGISSTKFIQLYLINVNLASATELANVSSLYGRSFIAYERVDQATGVHKTVYQQLGTVARDTTIYRTASPSEKLTPSNATTVIRLRSGIRRKSVASGATVTISCYVYKDSSYNGATVRLILLANPAIGILVDTVIDSMTVGSATWEQLTGTIAAASEAGGMEFCVEVTGTAGNVYTDDWS